MFAALARFVIKRSTAIIVGAVVLLVLFIVLGSLSFSKLQGGGFDSPNSQSTTAKNLITRNFGGGTNIVFLVQAKQDTVDSAALRAAGEKLADSLAHTTAVSNVSSYWQTGSQAMRSKDGRYALITAHVSKHTKSLVKRFSADTTLYRVQAGGGSPADIDINDQVGKSLGKTESLAIPLTLICLLLAFGTVVSALLPLIIALLSIFGTFAELFVLGSVTNVSIYAINLTTALGLGLAIDYALFIVSRYREELASGKEVPEAITHTIQTAGRSVVFSAAAVAAALGTMAVFPLYFLRSFAYAGVGVVVISALAALIVLPAILVKLGHGVEKGRLPWADRARRTEAPFWGRLARFVMARPVATALPVIILLLFIASPLRHITFGTPDDRVLPTSTATRQVGDALRGDFTTNNDGQVTVVLTGDVARPERFAQYAQQLSNLSHVDSVATPGGMFIHGQQVSSAAWVTPNKNIFVLRLGNKLDPQTKNAAALVRQVRAVAVPSGTQRVVGGNAAALVDAQQAIGSRLWLGAALIALSTFVILFLFSGSVIQPIRALLSNALTLAATFGLIVWMFQEGHFASVLNFTALPINITMPVLLFCISFGLSMDYEVFILSRIKERYETGVGNTEAVAYGMARAGRIVSTLAAILAISFFAFGVASISFLQLFGIGTGFAILIDATLVRGVLVPAFIHALGTAAWYAPAPLKRLYARSRVVEE
jgi:RND superfamily putative drug exporter